MRKVSEYELRAVECRRLASQMKDPEAETAVRRNGACLGATHQSPHQASSKGLERTATSRVAATHHQGGWKPYLRKARNAMKATASLPSLPSRERNNRAGPRSAKASTRSTTGRRSGANCKTLLQFLFLLAARHLKKPCARRLRYAFRGKSPQTPLRPCLQSLHWRFCHPRLWLGAALTASLSVKACVAFGAVFSSSPATFGAAFSSTAAPFVAAFTSSCHHQACAGVQCGETHCPGQYEDRLPVHLSPHDEAHI